MLRQEILIVLLRGHPVLEQHDSDLNGLIVLEARRLDVEGVEIRGKSLLERLQPDDRIILLPRLLMLAHS